MPLTDQQLEQIKQTAVRLAKEHGFQDLRVSDTDTGGYFERFKQWVDDGYHGCMSFLERNQELRQNPAELHPNTCRVLSLRFDYLNNNASFTTPLKDKSLANISRYALGRDYHKLMRKRLQRVIEDLRSTLEKDCDIDYRVLVDSAPVLETAFAEKSGLGWKGKHTLILNKDAGSWFFLGEIFINLPLSIDEPVEDLCGSCSSCINLCPTDAIIDDKKIDARRCISYLTIENQEAIPIELRPLMGNRIYGCDDCQLACPYNRFANHTNIEDFSARHDLHKVSLATLWSWDEPTFLNNFQGSPIRRIGYQNWLRNLAVAIGNSNQHEMIEPLKAKYEEANEMVREHIDWAVQQLTNPENIDRTATDKKTQKLIHCVTVMLPDDA
ncbi:tRNA epoxyqueuosine(34) reductase QueG [Kangiella aquimarina]|uniref:Epoxyqueuosine reductase n=1 Tax=Kangiella aquimarina TaxID=261965 RepID=A0ABZ0X580_9GAMM|nr:tRNA epoxyqueuosine(34) reductase QueG [Kangiella aquimarina]WQG85748.1 tRNA epoxyqueuosine(34) reductase QueG [Kangiella aquimarina]